MKYVGLDWAYRRAQWCALLPGGQVAGEGQIPADRDGLARLVLELGAEVKACLEMMSGALWVRDQLVACGWQVEVADARRVKTVAPLAAKTDKVDARLLAELSRRELVPALWLPSLDERALRERLRRRMHLVRLRTSAKGRIFGLQTQWGVRVSLTRLRRADGLTLLERAGVPEVWRRSVSECLALIDFLDARIAPLEAELRPFAKADPRAVLLDTIPGVAELLALTIAVEVGEISRFATPEKLVSYGRLAPRVRQSSPAAQRPAQQVRLAAGRLGGCRGGPAGLARIEPLARALPRRRSPVSSQQRGQGRGRAQDPDRRLAHALPQGALQARPSHHERHLCPGKLPLGFGRLTALMELRSRDSSHRHGVHS
jgi:transposase